MPGAFVIQGDVCRPVLSNRPPCCGLRPLLPTLPRQAAGKPGATLIPSDVFLAPVGRHSAGRAAFLSVAPRACGEAPGPQEREA